ncbi:MAG: hypothetical protein QOH11_1881 [Solirubrobacteraceae bacterium]|nr:hypothetical protein [Solirubrobacteraceae bacterium]
MGTETPSSARIRSHPRTSTGIRDQATRPRQGQNPCSGRDSRPLGVLLHTREVAGSKPAAPIHTGLLPQPHGFEGLGVVEVRVHADHHSVFHLGDLCELPREWDAAALTTRRELCKQDDAVA